ASFDSSRTACTRWPSSSPQVITSSDQDGVLGKRSSNQLAMLAKEQGSDKSPPVGVARLGVGDASSSRFGSRRTSNCQIAIIYLRSCLGVPMKASDTSDYRPPVSLRRGQGLPVIKRQIP